MQVRWNGTGSAWATHFGNSSAVLEAEGARLLFDCGHTVPSRLPSLGLTLADIPAVFISHLHGDHVYGLEEFGFRSFLLWKTRPHLLIPESLALPLWRNVLSGTMTRAGETLMILRDYFEIHLLQEDKPYHFAPWTLTIHPVRHVPDVSCYGVKIEAGTSSVGFTADTLADAAPFFYRGTQAVFHDCSFTPYTPTTVHAHFEQLEDYPEEFRRKTFLVHYDDETLARKLDPAWQKRIAHSQMRLTDPFFCYEF